MGRYAATFDDFASGVSDAVKTAIAMITDDDDKARARLMKLDIAPAQNTPADANAIVQVKRIADVSAGTAGTPGSTLTAANIPKRNTFSDQPLLTVKREYSAEPTTYETEPLVNMGFNAHAGLILEWTPDDAIVINRDQHLGVLVGSRTASAIELSGTIEIETF